MRNSDFVKSFIAGAQIAARRICKFSSTDTTVIQAAAVGDLSIGVSELGATASGDSVSLVMGGIATVEYGGNVTRGNELTSDSVGRAVAAAPAGGANNRIIGIAMMSGVIGDLGSVLIAPSMKQG